MATGTTLSPELAYPRPLDDSLYEVVNGVVVFPREVREETDEGTFENSLYEVVNGIRVETPMANDAVAVNTELGSQLQRHARIAGIGRVWLEGLFLLKPDATNKRRPDIAFVSYERWPREKRFPKGAAWPVAPDLAVEVVSPSDFAEDSLAKIREYFDAGVRQVWAVYPELQVIHVYESFTSIRVVSGQDILRGGEVVPGFEISLQTLFEDLGE